MKRPQSSTTWLCTLAVLATACGPDTADVVYISGRIYTVNETQPWVEAVAIADRKFVAVGTNAEIEPLIGEDTEVIDLGGAFAMPGIVDIHTHPFEDYHRELFQLALDGSSRVALLASVEAYAAANPEQQWITGGIWPIGMFEGDNPHRRLLDEIVPDRPVFLLDQNAHSAWLNTRALELSGLMDPDVELPAGSTVERDADGVPSGTVREYTIGFVRRSMPAVPMEEWVETGRRVQPVYHSNGITTAKLGAAHNNHVLAAARLAGSGELKMRWLAAMNYNYFDSPETIEEELEFIRGADRYVSEFFDPRGVKLFLDGATTSREAWMLEPYPGTDVRGNSYYDAAALTDLYTQFEAMDRVVMTHAIGDAAVRAVLDGMEAARAARPGTGIRHHLTHAQSIHADDLVRIRQLGIAADIGPGLALTPTLIRLGESLLSPQMWREWNPWRRAIDAGLVVAVASDWSVSPLPPFPRIHWMVNRRNADVPGMLPFQPENAVTVEEAIRAYTRHAAYAIDRDQETGSIEIGKFADMIVLDRNLLEIDPLEIADTEVKKTIFAGETVYEAN